MQRHQSQTIISGIKNSSHSCLNPTQLKSLLNEIITELGIPTGKIWTVTIAHNDGTILEANSNAATKWLSNKANQKKICEKLGTNIKFSPRNYKVLVYNVPTDMDPNNLEHLLEICKTNNINIDPIKISSAKWAKAIANRNSNQRSAHLYITFTNAEVANRVITNGVMSDPLFSFPIPVRGLSGDIPSCMYPFYIPYLLFIFYIYFTLLTYLFVTVWL